MTVPGSATLFAKGNISKQTNCCIVLDAVPAPYPS